MVAALSHHPQPAPWNEPGARGARPAEAAPGPRPALRLVDGGRAPSRPAAGVAPAWGSLAAGLLLALLVAVGALVGSHLLGADAAAPGPASTAAAAPSAGAGPSAVAPSEVVVEPGDTLWAIARRLQPTGDVRPLVDRLAERAGGVALVSGQHLDVSGLTD